MKTTPRIHTLHLNFKLTPNMGEAIRSYRAGHGISTEGEALRRLIDAGLKAVGSNGTIGIEMPERYVDTFEAEEEIDVAALQRDIDRIERELADVRVQMAGYLKELGVDA